MASAPVCRKRPFTTHADRLRPRLEGRRLPVAGPAARRAAGRGRRRRPARDSAAAYACSGRATCSSSGSSPASGRNLAHLVNTAQDLCHDQSLLPLDFVRGGLFMETELGYDTRVVVGWGGACSARPFTLFLCVRLAWSPAGRASLIVALPHDQPRPDRHVHTRVGALVVFVWRIDLKSRGGGSLIASKKRYCS